MASAFHLTYAQSDLAFRPSNLLTRTVVEEVLDGLRDDVISEAIRLTCPLVSPRIRRR
jgi:hypothetical protein